MEGSVRGFREQKEELRLLFACKNCVVMVSSLWAFGNDLQMHCISRAFCYLKFTIDLSHWQTVFELLFLCHVACTYSVWGHFFFSFCFVPFDKMLTLLASLTLCLIYRCSICWMFVMKLVIKCSIKVFARPNATAARVLALCAMADSRPYYCQQELK